MTTEKINQAIKRAMTKLVKDIGVDELKKTSLFLRANKKAHEAAQNRKDAA